MIFDEVKKNFGFGCMRLKINDDKVDYDEFSRMVDTFIDAGFNYFDTAHGYIDGKSETAIRDCLAKRHKREDFLLANKLSIWYVDTEDDVLPYFENQLKLCGVDYFDFYLFHSLNRENYPKYKQCNAFEIIKNLKKQGKIRHIALSFHDTADVLDMILSEQPSIEAVQLQINYLDYDNPDVQSKACYDVAVKHGKKVIVMEPVKGGALVNLPQKAADVLDSLNGGSHASYAIRYAASFPEVFMVLSGMGNMDMLNENISYMSDFVPLSQTEQETLSNVREIIREVEQIQCTKCNYCGEVCPNNIPISELFSVYNEFLSAKATRAQTKERLPQYADCIECGKCEKICPQNIKIRDYLKKIDKIRK